MLPDINLIIAATGKDAKMVRNAGLPCLHLSCTIGENGTLIHKSLPPTVKNDFLGISDFNYTGSRIDVENFSTDVVYEAKRRGYAGIFADFEHKSPNILKLVSVLDKKLKDKGLEFFVPAAFGVYAPNAYVVVETAVSGGSLTEVLEEYKARFGEQNIAAQLVRTCMDFTLPSTSNIGKLLTKEEFDSLQRKYNASVFFSRELCSKYFTYMDEHMNGHFVLFDDSATMEKKLSVIDGMGIKYKFMVYPDAAELFSI